VDIANSGKTKYYKIYVKPELGKKFPSVETLYDVPKVEMLWQRESPDYKHIVVMKIIVV